MSKDWGLGNIRPRDAFRPIACEQKYLMDYNSRYRSCYPANNQKNISVAGQNEIQVKMKFLCLLTLIIHGS